MADETLRPERRIRRRSDFVTLRERGISRAHPLLVLRAVPNALPHTRFGFIVGRRVSAKSVDRNRVRRRVREVARRSPVSLGWDVLLIARPAALDADYKSIKQAVDDLARRAGLYHQPQGLDAGAGG